MTINEIERHFNTKEVLVSLDNDNLIVVVAPAGDELDEHSIEAFFMPPNTGLVIDEGVRHYLPYPTARDTNCIVMYKNGTENTDLTFEPLSKTYKIEI